MIGGGTGPATGTNATTCTPGQWNIWMMLQAADAFPMNLVFLGKGNSAKPEGLIELPFPTSKCSISDILLKAMPDKNSKLYR